MKNREFGISWVYVGDNPNEVNVLAGSTSTHLVTHFYQDGEFDNVDFFFFSLDDALDAASLLEEAHRSAW